jgi:hypothetical protein
VNPGRRIVAGGQRSALIDAASDWEVHELRQRANAGLWSARVALVLSVPFAITAWATKVDDAWLIYMLLPTIAAFFAGSLFGAAIANPHEVTDESLAGRRGALVALATYVIFAMEVAAMNVSPLETGLNVFMGSLLVSAWVALPAAFFAGIMAFRAREGALRYTHTAKI